MAAEDSNDQRDSVSPELSNPRAFGQRGATTTTENSTTTNIVDVDDNRDSSADSLSRDASTPSNKSPNGEESSLNGKKDAEDGEDAQPVILPKRRGRPKKSVDGIVPPPKKKPPVEPSTIDRFPRRLGRPPKRYADEVNDGGNFKRPKTDLDESRGPEVVTQAPIFNVNSYYTIQNSTAFFGGMSEVDVSQFVQEFVGSAEGQAAARVTLDGTVVEPASPNSDAALDSTESVESTGNGTSLPSNVKSELQDDVLPSNKDEGSKPATPTTPVSILRRRTPSGTPTGTPSSSKRVGFVIPVYEHFIPCRPQQFGGTMSHRTDTNSNGNGWNNHNSSPASASSNEEPSPALQAFIQKMWTEAKAEGENETLSEEQIQRIGKITLFKEAFAKHNQCLAFLRKMPR